jgi:hypothetical protein
MARKSRLKSQWVELAEELNHAALIKPIASHWTATFSTRRPSRRRFVWHSNRAALPLLVVVEVGV